MEDYIVTPAGLHVNFYILASVYIKDSSSSTSHWLFCIFSEGIQSTLLVVFMSMWSFLLEIFPEVLQQLANMVLYECLKRSEEQRKYNFCSVQRDI